MDKPTRLPGLRRRALIVASGSLIAAPAIVRAQGRNGVALVIGNSKYNFESPLPNVKRDVPEVAKGFEALGLKTELAEDLGRDGLKRTLEKFGAAARGANFVAFYFAGHGVYWKNRTHIVPIDVDLTDERAIAELTSSLGIAKALAGAKAGMLVLDNCRNSAQGGWRQREARYDASMNTNSAKTILGGFRNGLLLCSTQPGCVALDGPAGQKSPFATAVLQELAAPSVDMQTFPERVRRHVLLATEGQQLTYDANTFEPGFTLAANGKQAGGSPGTAHDPSRVIELNNAYEFARQKELFLPPGLIAYRPPAGSPDALKVGSFAADAQVESSRGVLTPAPAIYIVFSAPDGMSAEVIFSSKSWADGASGGYWRFVTGKTKGSTLFYQFNNGSGCHMNFRDRNSGTVTIDAPNSAGKQFRFTRLDG